MPRRPPDPTRVAPSLVPFDPPGEVSIVDTLNTRIDDGRPMLNNYVRHVKVGTGQHGEVQLCYKLNMKFPHGHPERRIPVAMKSVKRDNARAEQMRRLRRQQFPSSAHNTPLADRLNTTEAKIRKEIAIMKKCRHPHVVRLYEVIDDRMRDKIYMVMEYLGGGEVKWKNHQHEPILTIDQTRRIMRDAVLGLEYLHHQGIIHRDIKPANLLWTDDRRQVKIGDFGVSHFSYAQRLASAGNSNGQDDPTDPILLDDSDLTRRAGTPSFLAPEVVFEHTVDPAAPPSPSTSASISHAQFLAPASGSHLSVNKVRQPVLATGMNQLQSQHPPRERPPITKSIDVWALGVTLYCLLFGKVPFVADHTAPGSEWSLYNCICNQDWVPEVAMGHDKVPTGGRHPPRIDTEGGMLMKLLEGFLQKDVKKRITLSAVKASPWILKDLPDPEKWLRVTSPTKVDVSTDEASDAMSSVVFRWNWGAQIGRRISSLLRTVRPQRSKEVITSPGVVQTYNGKQVSGGSSSWNLPKGPQTVSSPPGWPTDGGQVKGRGRNYRPQTAGSLTSTSTGGQDGRSRSIDRFSVTSRVTSVGAIPQTMSAPVTKPRRGSETVSIDHTNTITPSVTSVTRAVSASTSGASATPSEAASEGTQKSKSKFGFLKLGRPKTSHSGTSSATTSSVGQTTLTQSQVGTFDNAQPRSPPSSRGGATGSVGTITFNETTSYNNNFGATSSSSYRTTYGSRSLRKGAGVTRRSEEALRHYSSTQDTRGVLGNRTTYQQHQDPQHHQYPHPYSGGAHLGSSATTTSMFSAPGNEGFIADPGSSPPGDSSLGMTGPRRASSWGMGDQTIHPANYDIASIQSAAELNDHTMNVGAGGFSNESPYVPSRNGSKLTIDGEEGMTNGEMAGEYGDEEELLRRADSLSLGSLEGPRGGGGHVVGNKRRAVVSTATISSAGVSVSEEQSYDERHGPAYFDEDSSTIASAVGSGRWHRGSDLSSSEAGEDDDSLVRAQGQTEEAAKQLAARQMALEMMNMGGPMDLGGMGGRSSMSSQSTGDSSQFQSSEDDPDPEEGSGGSTQGEEDEDESDEQDRGVVFSTSGSRRRLEEGGVR